MSSYCPAALLGEENGKTEYQTSNIIVNQGLQRKENDKSEDQKTVNQRLKNMKYEIGQKLARERAPHLTSNNYTLESNAGPELLDQTTEEISFEPEVIDLEQDEDTIKKIM